MWLVRGKIVLQIRRTIEIAGLQEIALFIPLGDKSGLFHPYFIEPGQVAFDSLPASSGSEETGFCGSKCAGSCFASARATAPIAAVIAPAEAPDMTLSSDLVVWDLAGIRTVAGFLPFIERLDQEIENAGRIGAGRDRARHRKTNLKFLAPFLRHFWPPPMSKCRNDNRLERCRQARCVSGIKLGLEHELRKFADFLDKNMQENKVIQTTGDSHLNDREGHEHE